MPRIKLCGSQESRAYLLARREVLAIPEASVREIDKGFVVIETPLFYIRIIDQQSEVWIQLSVRKSFDRWANSVDFEIKRSMSKNGYHPSFLPQYLWAIKVVKSGLFDFDRYFSTIDLPWFDCVRNK